MQTKNGLDVSTNSSEVIEAIEYFEQELLSMGKGVVAIIDSAKEHADNLMIQLYAASFMLYGQTKETDAEAFTYLNRAKTLSSQGNEREKQLMQALTYWLAGKVEKGMQQLESLLQSWPKDLAAAKILEFFYYMRGQEYSGPRFLEVFEGIYSENKNSGYYLSSLSFAAELCGQYDKAFDLANQAIGIEKINPWAHHTLSHVLLKRGEISEGIKRLESYEGVWDQSGQAICSHNHWHLALMYLENLDHEKALSFVKNNILKEKPYIVIQHLDAISLLWRIEMGGYEVPKDTWVEIADSVKENSKDCYIPYMSAHYIYALAKAEKKDELSDALSKVKKASDSKSGHELEVWQRTGIPLLHATEAFAKGDYSHSVSLLEPIIANITEVGGSDAQVDLFRQTYLQSLINSNQPAHAKAYLDTLITSQQLTPLEEYWNTAIKI